MKILQLCAFSNLWDPVHQVESIDLKSGKNVFDLENSYGKNFDFIISSPPCTQYTVANNRNWLEYPASDVAITKKCLQISLESGKPWVMETTIGRIEKLLPELKKFRIGIWQSRITTKKHTVYSNHLFLFPFQKGNKSVVDIRNVIWRETWQKDFIEDIQNNVVLLLT